MKWRRLAGERKLGAGALQKRFGNEETETETEHGSFFGLRCPGIGPTMGHVRRAQAVDDFRSKSGTVVADGNADLLRRPLCGDFNPRMSEVDGIFDQIAEAISNPGVARAGGFADAALRGIDDDGNTGK
jgi:hypothetical protein